jgi:hypothetical protein
LFCGFLDSQTFDFSQLDVAGIVGIVMVMIGITAIRAAAVVVSGRDRR